jgi:hypothetical protein
MERILPVVRAEAFPHVKRPDRLRSLNSLAIGILRHQLLPMVRVDALVPAKISASTRSHSGSELF